MNREQWIAAKELFATVADLSDGDAERKLLHAGDPLVAAQVRKLLAADREVKRRGFLEALDLPPQPDPLLETVDSLAIQDTPATRERRIGTRVGRYRLTEFIAQGGMGAVYKAVRDEDYDQIVAVKILKESLDSPQLVARFHRERQSMAKLSHPGIARLYDGGTTNDDLPFLVMEYIDGHRLLRHCKERHFSIREKMELYRQIVEAVAYANSQSILHRDLKPSNILVRLNGTPVVTDFGLARPFEASDFSTQTAAIMGTPSYMAPEQVSGGDTTSVQIDVYGLGAILYELLTGRPPFQGAIPLETMRLVRNTAPTPPRSIDSQIHRDLETICLKCLEKEPGKRFATADDLLAEVDRWLSGRPIQSRPIGIVGWFARWSKRNPALATAMVVSTALLLGALIVVTTFWQSARHEKSRAEQSLQAARDVIRRLVKQSDALRLQAGQEANRRELQLTALEFSEQLATTFPKDESVLDDAARQNFFYGLLLSQGGGLQTEAANYYRRAIGYWEKLQTRFPDKAEYPYELYRAYWLLACLPQGTPSDEAAILFHSAFAILEDLTQRFPSDARYWDSLAALCCSAGLSRAEPEELVRYFERGIEVANRLDRDYPSQQYLRNAAGNMENLATVRAHRLGDFRGALENCQKAHDVRAELVRRFPDDLDFRIDLAYAKASLARFIALTPDHVRAEILYRDALAEMDRKASIHPTNSAQQEPACGLRIEFANRLAEQGRVEEAKAIYREVRPRLQAIASWEVVHRGIFGDLIIHLIDCPLEDQRDLALAESILRRMTAIYPTAARDSGELYPKFLFRRGDFASAIANCPKLDGSHSESNIDLCFLCAMSHAKLGQREAAARAFEAGQAASAPRRQIGNAKSAWQKEAEAIFTNANATVKPTNSQSRTSTKM